MGHNPTMTLAQSLASWTDADVAQHALGRAIGLFGSETEMRDHKRVFWTANRVGDALRASLMAFVDAGVLEHRAEPDDQFRWIATAP
jgi:hypothetical protein